SMIAVRSAVSSNCGVGAASSVVCLQDMTNTGITTRPRNVDNRIIMVMGFLRMTGLKRDCPGRCIERYVIAGRRSNENFPACGQEITLCRTCGPTHCMSGSATPGQRLHGNVVSDLRSDTLLCPGAQLPDNSPYI